MQSEGNDRVLDHRPPREMSRGFSASRDPHGGTSGADKVSGWGLRARQSRMAQDSTLLAGQNGPHFKTQEFFFSRIFHFTFSDHSGPWVREPSASEWKLSRRNVSRPPPHIKHPRAAAEHTVSRQGCPRANPDTLPTRLQTQLTLPQPRVWDTEPLCRRKSPFNFTLGPLDPWLRIGELDPPQTTWH